jgi:hypothetical protein
MVESIVWWVLCSCRLQELLASACCGVDLELTQPAAVVQSWTRMHRLITDHVFLTVILI